MPCVGMHGCTRDQHGGNSGWTSWGPEGGTQSAKVPVRRPLGHLWKLMGNGGSLMGGERELSDVNTNNPGSGQPQPSPDPQGVLEHVLPEEKGWRRVG